MFALQFQEKNAPLTQVQMEVPEVPEGYCLVKLAAAAYNRRDYWIQKGLYPNIQWPVVPGGDGAGSFNGREVVIDAGIGWGNDRRVQSDEYYLIGSPGQGAFAQYIAVPTANVYDKPAHLTIAEAAALPVAGVTAHRALFYRGEARPGEKVLITGAGGGVALMAAQFAIAYGMEVYVTSGDDTKIARTVELGAAGGVNYKEEDWNKKLISKAGRFDLIIDSAGGASFALLPKLLNPAGRIVTYGGSLGRINGLSPQVIFWRQLSIRGTSMGSPEDFTDMIHFVGEHQIRPVIDSEYTFDNAEEGIRMLEGGNQFGKLILHIPE